MTSRGILAAAMDALLAACALLAADVSVATVGGDDITGDTRVVTGVAVTETDPTVPAWAKAADPPNADFTTNNAALVGTVSRTITNEVTKSYVEGLGISGEPGNYGVVSNRAMNAVTTNANKTVILETARVSGGVESGAIGSFAHGEDAFVNAGRGIYAGGVSVRGIGDGAHAEGVGTHALIEAAHAEGYNTRATGYEAHSEGGFTLAEGEASHAEGFHSSASGDAAHAAGVRATATDHASFVWQGTAVNGTSYSKIPLYGSHGRGTFSVNPVGGASGFWIGNKTIGQLVSDATNGLPTVEYVDTAIDRLAAYYITANAKGDAFPTLHSLTNAAAYWSGGEARTPTRNDYAVVLADESHGNAEWRYIYAVAADGVTGQWEAQYPIETNDYDALSNRPQINGVTLGGTNNTAVGLGLLGTGGGTITGTLQIGGSDKFPITFDFDAGGAAYMTIRDSIGNFIVLDGNKLYYQQYDVEYGAELFFPTNSGTLALTSDITVKSVKRNGTPLTPDSSGAVDVAVPSIAGQTFDFSTNAGLYLAVSNLITVLGGSLTNFPVIPQGGN